MTEQGIRDLKSNPNEAVISLAQVESVTIRLRREADEEVRRPVTPRPSDETFGAG